MKLRRLLLPEMVSKSGILGILVRETEWEQRRRARLPLMFRYRIQKHLDYIDSTLQELRKEKFTAWAEELDRIAEQMDALQEKMGEEPSQ